MVGLKQFSRAGLLCVCTVPGHPSHSCYILITGRRNEIMFPVLAVEIVTLWKILGMEKRLLMVRDYSTVAVAQNRSHGESWLFWSGWQHVRSGTERLLNRWFLFHTELYVYTTHCHGSLVWLLQTTEPQALCNNFCYADEIFFFFPKWSWWLQPLCATLTDWSPDGVFFHSVHSCSKLSSLFLHVLEDFLCSAWFTSELLHLSL